jgi:hypothetical protein
MLGSQVFVTSAFSLLAAVTAAFIVHWLTRSREHRVWVRDCRMKEWQELLNSLTHAYMTLLLSPPGLKMNVLTPEEEPKKDALADVDIVLGTRIFIAKDVERLDVRKKWADNVSSFLAFHDKAAFKTRFQALRLSVVEAAKLTS